MLHETLLRKRMRATAFLSASAWGHPVPQAQHHGAPTHRRTAGTPSGWVRDHGARSLVGTYVSCLAVSAAVIWSPSVLVNAVTWM